MLTTTQSPQHPLAPILSVIISETLRASLLEHVRWLISHPRLHWPASTLPIRMSVSLFRFPHVQSEIKALCGKVRYGTDRCSSVSAATVRKLPALSPHSKSPV